LGWLPWDGKVPVPGGGRPGFADSGAGQPGAYPKGRRHSPGFGVDCRDHGRYAGSRTRLQAFALTPDQPLPTGSPASTETHDIFVGNGEMATLMRAHDWASTPLGPPESWPEALKVALRILLTSRFEMWLGWGPDILFFYNDAYRPTLGLKHPASLAMPTRDLWPEIWQDVEPRLRQVYERGEATWDRALQLIVQRSGYPEETYHTFSYSPLLDDDGKVGGVFCAVSEETERVVTERRMGSLRELAAGLAAADTRETVLRAVEERVGRNLHDLPFTLTYFFDEDGSARLACATGIGRGHAAAPGHVAAGDAGTWPLARIWSGEDAAVLEGGDVGALPAGLPGGAWDKAPASAILVALTGQGTDRPYGAMVVGLNPYRPFDTEYLGFVRLVAGQISSSLANAEAYEAERRRAEALAEAVRLRQEAADALARVNENLTVEVEQRTAERDRLQNLFRQAPGFMCVLRGPDHVFELMNEAYLQLVGHRDLLGLPIREALPEIEGQGFFELLDEVHRTGKPFVGRNMPVSIQREPGSALVERVLHLVYQPIFEADGSVYGIFAEGYDVTHQVRAEEALRRLNETLEQRVTERTNELEEALERLRRESAERERAQEALRQAQKMDAIGKLTGGVAHDFNNLLQVVGGNLQLLAKDIAGNERAETRVRNALAGVSRGSRLASQLLAFGRRQPLEPKVVNIGRFVKNMDDMLRRALGEQVEVETVIAGGLWNTLVDPGQIENAILNLAINARDAMDGHGRLTIEAGNAMLDDDYALGHDVEAGQYVMLAVTDTGSGIAPEVLERVFEPFFSTKPEGKGTGLGLSMVYGFVKQSGGHIKIYSELGHGTTVKIYLPRAQQSEDMLADTVGVPVRGGDETILVVEDDEEVREIAVSLLADLGYRILKAKDAQSALSVIESGARIDLLFTDVVMPGPLRSPELARKARERIPGIAVLFTSGYTENAIVHGGRLDPGVELLSKPYTREALARKIRHVLGNRAQQALARQREAGAAPAVRPETANGAAGRTGQAAGARVLLVEDDDLIRSSTAGMLEELGHTVFEAAGAQDALVALRANQFEVLVTDVGLPGVRGTELARLAGEIRPGIGIVFATGDEGAPAEARVPNAVQLLKPYTIEDLRQALHEARLSEAGQKHR
jgi:signal transduction histidine kinase/DNA-binding response OmpR family regulator